MRSQRYTCSVQKGREKVDLTTPKPSAAELLDMSGKIGEISPGAFADIIAVKEDPLKDIAALEHVGFVMKDGKVYKQKIGGSAGN